MKKFELGYFVGFMYSYLSEIVNPQYIFIKDGLLPIYKDEDLILNKTMSSFNKVSKKSLKMVNAFLDAHNITEAVIPYNGVIRPSVDLDMPIFQ